jgi:hypothetical protein
MVWGTCHTIIFLFLGQRKKTKFDYLLELDSEAHSLRILTMENKFCERYTCSSIWLVHVFTGMELKDELNEKVNEDHYEYSVVCCLR